MRLTLFVSILLLVAAPAVAAGPGGCCKGKGAEGAPMAGAGPGGCCGMGGGCAGNRANRGGASDHDTIHGLLDRHDAIERTVEEIDGGVLTVTVSEDPEVVAMIRDHARDMKRRIESGQGMRWWDPTFAELFEHHDKIVIEIEEIEGGVRVRETSDDPAVALLIRQHAVRGVSEFVDRGHERAMEETPLPEGYGD